jgi:hypothetical protein
VHKSKPKIHFALFRGAKRKTENARAIVNMKQLSKLLRTPAPVNFPDISQILEGLSRQSPYWLVGDSRHYFHQFDVGKGIQPYLGIECGGNAWMCKTMPMGLSWSPRVAQSAGWCMILESCFRAKILQPEEFQGLANPPAFIRRDGLFIALWIDKIIVACDCSETRDLLHDKLIEVTGDSAKGYNCTWKNLTRWNLNQIGPNSNKKPNYLGIEFCMKEKKRLRDETSAKTLHWRHVPERTKRWADFGCHADHCTPRVVARGVGVILWDATMSLRSFCHEDAMISMLRLAGAEVRQQAQPNPQTPGDRQRGWDKLWCPDNFAALQARVKDIVDTNAWRCDQRPVETTSHLFAASDASGDIGFGSMFWNGDKPIVLQRGMWRDHPKMISSHIYIKEFFAACLAVEELCRRYQHTKIYLGVDNTAVSAGLRCGYSTNKIGNEFIARVEAALLSSQNCLEIVALRSDDNAADCPSRNKPLDANVCSRCRSIIEDWLTGKGRTAVGEDDGLQW